jgi:hypothetical protein
LTPSTALGNLIQQALQRQLAALPRQEEAARSLQGNSALIRTRDLSEAVTLANAIGAEHLELMLEDPEAWLDRFAQRMGIELRTLDEAVVVQQGETLLWLVQGDFGVSISTHCRMFSRTSSASMRGWLLTASGTIPSLWIPRNGARLAEPTRPVDALDPSAQREYGCDRMRYLEPGGGTPPMRDFQTHAGRTAS